MSISFDRRRRTAGTPARRSAAVAAVCGLLLNTGCSLTSGPASDSEDASGLSAALGKVSSEPETRIVGYTDSARLRELTKEAPERFADFRPFPDPELATELSGSAASKYRIDPDQIEERLWIQSTDSPLSAGYWRGVFDSESITKKLKAEGRPEREQDGVAVWGGHEDSQNDYTVSDQEFTHVHPVGTRVFHPADGKALADKAEYRQLVACLGDVYSVSIEPRQGGSDPRQGGKGLSHLAIGQLARSVDDTSGVVCAVARSRESALKASETVKAVLKGQPQYAGSEVTVLEGDEGEGRPPVVKVVVPDNPGDKKVGKIARRGPLLTALLKL
ncbi:hypothetical protein DKG34_21580 [Streptomyces sp. NWU49]|uniref:hypothetical protein n=1 Tax=Streptomyces sp. NWU49 TaxID=2201153 RepID=UPI000D6761CD|nr:hypothetical protein [Streptomyces sp. NWU49]PWJ05393.1 hypothetical protein DKG34_21580 [Streptomyces sp. NWU49]